MYSDDRDPATHRPAWETQPSHCFFLVADESDAPAPEGEDSQDSTAKAVVCRAFSAPLEVSDRQRDLVCLTRVHMTCPRYLRANAAVETFLADGTDEERRRMRPAALLSKAFDAALVVALIVIALVAAAALASPFLPLTAANPTPASTPSVRASVPPTTTPLATGTVSAAPTPPASPPSGSPRPTTAPKSTSSWPPGATASRMNLVTPCRDQARCYFYTVRIGQNLKGIAAFFGVSLDAILAMNASITNPDYVQAGQTIRIPPPSR